jgi:hypothetical protein
VALEYPDTVCVELLLLLPEYSEVRHLTSIGNPTSLPHCRLYNFHQNVSTDTTSYLLLLSMTPGTYH